MAAVSLEASNKVWQRVAIALRGANEASQQQFKALKMYLATQKGNPQLQFVPINGTTSSSDGTNTASQVLLSGPCTLYGIYLKKASGATAVWFKGSNHASTATTDGTQVITEHSALASEEIVRSYITGKTLATGLTVTENTTATGSTLTLLANRFDGFVITG